MTRTTDTFIPLEERAAFADRFRDGIFVCIHYNAGSDFGTGIENDTLAPRFVPSTGDDSPSASYLIPCAGNVEDPENMALATAMHAALLSRLPMVDRGIKRARFCVLRLCTIPGVVDRGWVREQSTGSGANRAAVLSPGRGGSNFSRHRNYNRRDHVPASSRSSPGTVGAPKAFPEHHAGMMGIQNGVPPSGRACPSKAPRSASTSRRDRRWRFRAATERCHSRLAARELRLG